MTIDILSDLHLDFHLKSEVPLTEKRVKHFCDVVFENRKSDTLIIAGDIGHYNWQNYEVLKYLSENYYKHIVCVLGNHDYYLINESQAKKYNRNSFERVDDLRLLLNSIDNVHCLNGDVVVIDGVRFGGCDGWYDGSYYRHFSYGYGDSILSLWKSNMNDAKLIFGIVDFYELAGAEKKKIKEIYKECDVMITHVSPSSLHEDLHEDKQYQRLTAFYTFDGSEYLEETTAKYWVYGHMHKGIDYVRDGVKCVTAALGYPKESQLNSLKSVVLNFER